MKTIDDVYAIAVEIRDMLRGGARPTAAGGEIASAADLDSERGNPTIRKDPRDWKGQSYVGRRYSDATPDYLDMLAALKEWQAKRDDDAGARGEKTPSGYPRDGKFARLDAARARGWAQRLRNGWQRSAAAPVGDVPADDFGGADDIPF